MRRPSCSAWERLVEGEIEPTVRDALAASKLLSKYDPVLIERDVLRQREKEGVERLMRLFAVVESTLGEENWDRLSLALSDDPDLKLFQVLYVREHERRRPRRRRVRAS